MNTKFRAWDEEKQKMFYRVMVGNCDQNDENRNTMKAVDGSTSKI